MHAIRLENFARLRVLAIVAILAPASMAHAGVGPQVYWHDDSVEQSTHAPVRPTVALPLRDSATRTSAVSNIRINDPSLTPPLAQDITPSIAALGNRLLAVWYTREAAVDVRLRAAHSIDGGATWIQDGTLPALPGTWKWRIDPNVVADPFTDQFYICSQASQSNGAAGIGFVSAQISSGLTWGTSSIVQQTFAGPSSFSYIDQLSMGCSLYHSSRLFIAFWEGRTSIPTLSFLFSDDGGVTWGPTIVTADARQGFNPRVVGTIYSHDAILTWEGLDPFSPSRDSLAHWSAYVTPGFASYGPLIRSHRLAFGTLPGNGGLADFQTGLALSPTAGNLLVTTWIEGGDLSPWPSPSSGIATESGPNDTAATAQFIAASIGTVNGTFSTPGRHQDPDFYKVNLSAGEHLLFRLGDTSPSPVSGSFMEGDLLSTDGYHVLAGASYQGDTIPSRVLFTAPVPGNYFVRVFGADVTNYRLTLVRSTAAAAPARDRRDLFVSTSYNEGYAWSSPVRIDAGAVGYDLGGCQLAIGNDGRPYVFWYDFSTADVEGRLCNLRVTRSADGGATWAQPVTLTTKPTDWQNRPTDPNMGVAWRFSATTTPPAITYAAQPAPSRAGRRSATLFPPTPSDVMHVAWVDGRDTDAEIYTAHFSTSECATCPQPYDTTAAPGQHILLPASVSNDNPLFPLDVRITNIQKDRNWPVLTFPFTVSPASAAIRSAIEVDVPDSAATGVMRISWDVDVGGAMSVGCTPTAIHVTQTSDAGAGLPAAIAFDPPAPNPALRSTGFAFALPAAGRVSLAVFDVNGHRVRLLSEREWPAGDHRLVWDGHDDAGHPIPAGIYFARFTAGNTRVVRRLAWLR